MSPLLLDWTSAGSCMPGSLRPEPSGRRYAVLDLLSCSSEQGDTGKHVSRDHRPGMRRVSIRRAGEPGGQIRSVPVLVWCLGARVPGGNWNGNGDGMNAFSITSGCDIPECDSRILMKSWAATPANIPMPSVLVRFPCRSGNISGPCLDEYRSRFWSDGFQRRLRLETSGIVTFF